jgi:signal transduction histidine kinase
VLADPSKLHDVLRNLIENAIAYSPEGGTITVGTHRDGDWIAIEVADRGPGIPNADLTRVFERFYRVDKSRGEEPGGTGLGLAIARHLVGLLEGQIWAGNRPGGGAMFTVRLHAADGGAPAGSSAPKVTGPHSGPRAR